MFVMKDSSMLIGTNEKKEKENARRGIFERKIEKELKQEIRRDSAL